MRGSRKSQLLITVHGIAKKLALGEQVDVILLDLSKAFDKVPHQRLLHKLHYYGVGNKTLSWIQSCSCPTQSTPRYCPRPSSLPDIYLSDLPDAVRHSSARLFADDSLLYRRIKDQHDQALLQEDIDSLG